MTRTTGGSWAAFLIMSYLVAGLAGMFAVYAAQLPFQRALARDQALDQLLRDGTVTPSLSPAFGMEKDAALLTGPGTLPDRIAVAREHLHADELRQAGRLRNRLLVFLGVTAAACALFGGMVLSIVRRSKPV